MNDIKNKIKQLIQVKKPRYISKQYIQKTFGDEFLNAILSQTLFLNDENTISERLFCILNNIKQPVTCLHCHTLINNFEKFYETKEQYLERFCSRKCIRKYMYDMTTDPVEVQYDSNFVYESIKSGKLNKLRSSPSFMNLVKLELYKQNIHFQTMTALEALYFLRNQLKEVPKCYCGNDVRYFGKGVYRKYCSNKCKAMAETQKQKIKATCQRKYGTENVFQDKNIKNKIKETNLLKYGVDHYCKTSEYKDRIKNGDIVKPPINYENMRKLQFDKTYERFIQFRDKLNIIPLFQREDYNGSGYHKLYNWKCLKCGLKFEHWYYEINKLKCPKCTTATNIEEIIIDYLSTLKLKFSVKNRSIIPPYELDIYIPEKKIGIEINGLYWHSELKGTTRLYHLNKTKECEKQGVRLIHLFADEIMYQLPIVKARLKHISGTVKRKIYARKCVVKPITVDIKNRFLNKYHIQGEDKSSIYLGLFFKKHLVAVMTFSKLRKVLAQEHKEHHYELTRFSTINNFVIVGGAAKLLKHFEIVYNPILVISYADRRWSQGNLYYKLGFTLDHTSSPNHWYTKDYLHRIYRFNFRKNVLVHKLTSYDANLSEWENMKANGYDRIWDCGNLVFKKNYS